MNMKPHSIKSLIYYLILHKMAHTFTVNLLFMYDDDNVYPIIVLLTQKDRMHKTGKY